MNEDIIVDLVWNNDGTRLWTVWTFPNLGVVRTYELTGFNVVHWKSDAE